MEPKRPYVPKRSYDEIRLDRLASETEGGLEYADASVPDSEFTLDPPPLVPPPAPQD